MGLEPTDLSQKLVVPFLTLSGVFGGNLQIDFKGWQSHPWLRPDWL